MDGFCMMFIQGHNFIFVSCSSAQKQNESANLGKS